MAIVFEPGVSIEGGISIVREPPTMRSLLSTAGQAAYDFATTDSWFAVSSTDYANVKAGLTNVSTIGCTDNQMLNAGQNFAQSLGATLDIANAAVPAGYYIIGLSTKTGSTGSGETVFRPSISGTFRGIYSGMGVNAVTMNSTQTIFYWLRKLPEAPVNFTSYVAVGVPNAGSNRPWAATGNWGSGATGGAYSLNMSTWTTFTSTLPAQQWILTNVQQW